MTVNVVGSLLKYVLGTVAMMASVSSCASRTLPPTTPLTLQQSQSRHSAPAGACPCLYVADFGSNSITVYGLKATGNVKPLLRLTGPNTKLNQPADVAVSKSGTIYVANASGGSNDTGSVTVYGPGANGDVAPLQTIGGTKAGLEKPQGIALDSSGKIYVANYAGGSLGEGSVTIYRGNSTGNVAPIGTIEGSKTQLFGPAGLVLDADDTVYVPNGEINSVTVYAAGSDGNVAPKRTISGSKTGLEVPYQVALDRDLQAHVANFTSPNPGSGSVTVYASSANGNAAPTKKITGGKTKLSSPDGIALDENGTTYVSDLNMSITIYPRNASGNVAPIAIIKGKKTKLSEPEGITIR